MITTSFFHLALALVVLPTGIFAPDPPATAPTLANLIPSHGLLSPPFSADTFDYVLTLPVLKSPISIVPEASTTSKDRALPAIFYQIVAGSPSTNFTAYKPMSQFQLPSDGSPFYVHFKVFYHETPKLFNTYKIKVDTRNSEAELGLVGITATTSDHRPVQVTADPQKTIFYLNVSPGTTSVILSPVCFPKNTATVNGIRVDNAGSYKMTKEKLAYEQLATVACSYKKATKQYVVFIRFDIPVESIATPRLFINDGTKQQCASAEPDNALQCPITFSKSPVQLLIEGNPMLKYNVKSAGSDKVNIRLINNKLSAPLPVSGSSKFVVVAEAGEAQKTFGLTFVRTTLPYADWLLSVLVAVVTLALTVAILAVSGVGSFVGIGSPIGVTETLSMLTLAIQYLQLTSKWHHHPALEHLISITSCATLLWPEPSMSTSMKDFFRDVGKLQVDNARGCLIWSALILLVVVALHLVVIANAHFQEARTFQHCLRFGTWEQIILHWLEFPVVAAATYLVFMDAQVFWKVISYAIIAFYVVWALSCAFTIKQKIENKSIVWVWQYPLSQMSEEFDAEAGYWSDSVCDQLTTQPVNRSILGKLFPWQWSATVGDIQPINICVQPCQRDSSGSTEFGAYDAFGNGTSPYGTVGRHVDVLQTVSPNQLCPGRRLICGLFRTDWLEILFSYQALTQFYASQHREMWRRFVTVPLTVKTCQLSGPFAGGVANFFFNGIDNPFGRVIDIICRCLLAFCIGLALSEPVSTTSKMIAYGGGLVISALFAMLYLLKNIHSRLVSNIAGFLLYAAIALGHFKAIASISSTAAFLGIPDWVYSTVTLAVVGGLTAYAALVVVLIVCAVICPPLEQTTILENFANCNVTISDHGNAWAAEVPGYSKRMLRDLKAQCSVDSNNKLLVSMFPSGEVPNLEFSVRDIAEACSTETLPQPALAVFTPDSNVPLGYRWTNIYDINNSYTHIHNFLLLNDRYRLVAESAAKSIAHQLQNEENYRKALLCVTVVLAKKGGGLSPKM